MQDTYIIIHNLQADISAIDNQYHIDVLTAIEEELNTTKETLDGLVMVHNELAQHLYAAEKHMGMAEAYTTALAMIDRNLEAVKRRKSLALLPLERQESR